MSVHPDYVSDEPHKQSCDNYYEPLGYQHFLYDVNIEYSPGGRHSQCNKHSFKLKYLPYMIQDVHKNINNIRNSNNNNNNDNCELRKNSVSSSNNSSINNFDQINRSTTTTTTSSSSSSSTSPQNHQNHIDDSTSLTCNTKQNDHLFKSTLLLPEHIEFNDRYVDVTKETCAFLSNSDYVPNYCKSRRQTVHLELISAKLSQSTHLLYNTSHTSLVTLAEQQTAEQIEQAVSCNNSSNQNVETTSNNDTSNVVHLTTSNSNNLNPTISPPPISPISSKRFVNYTILIKKVPGLDKNPAVIERRFSDFLKLYQGLKSHEPLANIIDRQISFPKKVYMGNFSLTNIAERSIEFSRLLSLCMTNVDLLWSTPFVSFLLDKELKEAHRLSSFGDPDDVQALIETAYYIEKKLYLNHMIQSSSNTNTNSSISSDSPLIDNNDKFCNSSNSSPQLPSNGSLRQANKISNHAKNNVKVVNISQGEIHSSGSGSFTSDGFVATTSSNTSAKPINSIEPMEHSIDRSVQLMTGSEIESDNSLLQIKRNLTPLNQRLLVTFCMLFITYYRGENYRELKLAIQDFSQMISSQEYVDSMLNTRHYMTLRACLLFLMNINRGGVIDDHQRFWLKRRLEDIDGSHADLNISFDNTHQNEIDFSSSNDVDGSRNKRKVTTNHNNNDSLGYNNNPLNTTFRMTKGDLTSLLRDRNFCSFQGQ